MELHLLVLPWYCLLVMYKFYDFDFYNSSLFLPHNPISGTKCYERKTKNNNKKVKQKMV